MMFYSSKLLKCTFFYAPSITFFSHKVLQYPFTFTDDNECDTNNGGCSHTCINTPRSFICYCNDGYSLDSNGLNCSGKVIWNFRLDIIVINLLLIVRCTNGDHSCEHNCHNTDGSYTCSCNSGYSLTSNNKSCSGKHNNN